MTPKRRKATAKTPIVFRNRDMGIFSCKSRVSEGIRHAQTDMVYFLIAISHRPTSLQC